MLLVNEYVELPLYEQTLLVHLEDATKKQRINGKVTICKHEMLAYIASLKDIVY